MRKLLGWFVALMLGAGVLVAAPPARAAETGSATFAGTMNTVALCLPFVCNAPNSGGWSYNGSGLGSYSSAKKNPPVFAGLATINIAGMMAGYCTQHSGSNGVGGMNVGPKHYNLSRVRWAVGTNTMVITGDITGNNQSGTFVMSMSIVVTGGSCLAGTATVWTGLAYMQWELT